MRRARPEAVGHAPQGPLDPVGTARRFALARGAELWRFDEASEAVAGRMFELGTHCVGGFVDGGVDDAGVWLVRAAVEPTLRSWFGNDTRHPWRDCVSVAAAIARALAACEAAHLFPGRLSPRGVTVQAPGALMRADELVHSLLGLPGADPAASAGAASRWVAPEQAQGAPPDHAGNRYTLGLMLYRALSGHHPFAGKGLRFALADQAARGAAPLPEEVAAELPPGLQSFLLHLLDIDPVARPATANEVAKRLEGFLRTPAASVRAAGPAGHHTVFAPAAASDAEPLVPRRPSTLRQRLRTLALGVLPIAGGLGLAALMTGAVDPPPDPPAKANVGESDPLSAERTNPDDCATCHPRQTAQWHVSVMAHSVKSPLFQGLEMLIEEQVGREFGCPEGAGILRRTDGRTACRDRDTGLPVTGSGGEHWCVNCHSPADNLRTAVPPWNGIAIRSESRKPLRDLLPASSMEGISCAFCHQVHGPVTPGSERAGLYEGNPFWTSTQTGQRFSSRPEDRQGRPGIANSGYFLDPAEFLASLGRDRIVPGGAHRRPTDGARDYLASSRFCGACHDVRLFGTDALAASRFENFKRLRNAYSEWVDWADLERRAGRQPASCQDCHMSAFPGICVPDGGSAALVGSFAPRGATALSRACPPGTRFEGRAPGSRPTGTVATSSGAAHEVSTHYFSGVDVPLTPQFPAELIDDASLDAAGIPRGAKQRRDLLLGATFRFDIEAPRRFSGRLEIPIVLENTGAGHRVPAGFSQEREFWVHLEVRDAAGRTLYEVGRVDRGDEDLRDKVFLRVNTDDSILDDQGRPEGLFGADVADGPDVAQWEPDPALGGTQFRGRGLVNLQNGFLRCVTCIGFIDAQGKCQPRGGQDRRRGDRFDDGKYDIDTGECESNLRGQDKFFEVYFPVGALDAARGLLKGPDAIIDTRSAAPGVALRYTYDLPVGRVGGPITVRARLLFRAFPPFLVRAFADYEARQAARGKRPSGPLVTRDALQRLEVVELHRVETVIQ